MLFSNPEPTRIIAIRHGETAWNVDTRIQGQLDIGLNAHGQWQAEQAAKALADETIDAIYASDLLRAWATAQAVAQVQKLSLRTHEGLRERGFGDFEGLTFKEIEAKLPDQALRWRKREPDFAPQGGESLNGFRDRVVGTVTQIANAHPGQCIAVVAHGGVMDVLYRAATKLDLQAPRTWSLDNAAINRLLFSTSGGLHLTGWNDVSHLQGHARDELAG
jgi:2,3-bisphosphoglycerate-dependent phosphoglycerate mutase